MFTECRAGAVSVNVMYSQAPYHLTRRGWGEFPVRVQLHFRNGVTKSVDIIHKLTVCYMHCCSCSSHLTLAVIYTLTFGLILYTLCPKKTKKLTFIMTLGKCQFVIFVLLSDF